MSNKWEGGRFLRHQEFGNSPPADFAFQTSSRQVISRWIGVLNESRVEFQPKLKEVTLNRFAISTDHPLIMFGKHLVDRGLLQESCLLEALKKQQQMTVSFGRLAHQLGLMTLDQILEILQAQQGSELKFGALAVAKGFLDDEQVEAVIEAQRDSHLPIGQVLAALGLVGPEVLDKELRLYLAENSPDPG